VSRPLVYVVVLNWNNYADTAQCIESVYRQTYEFRHILVIDNGSTNGSAMQLRHYENSLELLLLQENKGYTGANNIGMAHAFAHKADYVWLLNNDATAEPTALARLVEIAEAAPDIGLASPLIRTQLDAPAVEFACGRFDLTVPSYLPSGDVALARQWHAVSPDRVVLHGTGLLVCRALWERIGGLDDTFFAYWEDVDYSIRSVLAGFRNVTAFDVAIGHEAKPTMTAPEVIRPHVYYYVARNELLMWRKYVTGRRYLRATLWNLSRQLQQIARMRTYDAGTQAILAGLWDGWRGMQGPRGMGRMPQPLCGMLRRWPKLWVTLLDRL
jgi:GT2 family glycosyltransferase